MAASQADDPDTSLCLAALGVRVRLACPDHACRDLLVANFGAMLSTHPNGPADIDWRIIARPGSPALRLIGPSEGEATAGSRDDVVFAVEQALTVALQRARPDLLFLHAAALAWRGDAHLLVGDAGAGKSTLAWALLHVGFGYLSDELAAVDPATREVLAYPHALALKAPVPGYPIPAAALCTRRATHIPCAALPSATITTSRPIRAVFLVERAPRGAPLELRPLSVDEAAARLYVCTLNALAHRSRGLDAVLALAAAVPCYLARAAEPAVTAARIRDLAATLTDAGAPP